MSLPWEQPVVGNCTTLYRSAQLSSLLRLISLPGDGIAAPIILVLIASAMVFFYKKDKVFALILLLAPLVGQVSKSLLKNHLQIPRPEAFGCEVMTTYGDQYSFPSGHTIFFTVFFGLLAYLAWQNRESFWAKIAWFGSTILILSIGYSRIYLGAHWYLDVIGGYVLGGAILAMAILAYEYSIKRKPVTDDRVFDQHGNVRAAGAIVHHMVGKTREYLLVFRRYQADYSFPKGRIEKGESAKTAAIREVLEETGYKIKITGKLKPISYNYPEGGGVVVEMFEATAIGTGKKIETNEREQWVTEDKVVDLLTYPNLKTYFKKYLEEKQ